jgi:hypothetical protein
MGTVLGVQRVFKSLEVLSHRVRRKECCFYYKNRYHVQIGILFIYRTHELIKFLKKSEKITHILSILRHLCIKLQIQNLSNECTIKGQKF